MGARASGGAAGEAAGIEVHDRRDTGASSDLDPTTLDPNMYYRWARADQSRIGTLKGRGYRIIRRSEGVKTIFEQDDDEGTDSIRHGDRILVGIAKEVHDRKLAENNSLRESRLRRPTNKFIQDAKKAGVKVVQGEED